VTLTYDLLTLAMSGELSFTCPVHVPIISILQLSVPELYVIILPSPGTVTAHAQYHVTCAQGVPQNHT